MEIITQEVPVTVARIPVAVGWNNLHKYFMKCISKIMLWRFPHLLEFIIRNIAIPVDVKETKSYLKMSLGSCQIKHTNGKKKKLENNLTFFTHYIKHYVKLQVLDILMWFVARSVAELSSSLDLSSSSQVVNVLGLVTFHAICEKAANFVHNRKQYWLLASIVKYNHCF